MRIKGIDLRLRILICIVVCICLAVPVYAESVDEAKIKVSSMSKDDVMKEYHYYFDLNNIQKNELAARGYSENQIAKIDKQGFAELESNWVISKEQVFYIKGTHPELKDVDISNWTNADVQAFRQSLYMKEKAKLAPSQDQIAELSKRNISLEMADKMLRDYIYYDNLLAQSDDTLNRLKDKIIEADEQGDYSIKYKKALKEKYTDYIKQNGGAE